MKTMRVFLLTAFIAIPAAAQPPSGPEQELVAVEHAWGEALIQRDIPALEKLYATEYRFTDPFGVMNTREQDIASANSGDFVLTAFEISDVKVSVYGKVAVMTGLNRSQASFKGMDASGEYRFTDVFVKRDGRWQVVTSHLTRVAPPP